MDETALFERRVKKYKGMILGIIGRHAAEHSIREDLMQQTFLRAWIHRDSFQGKSQYQTWLCRIAINTTINYLISQKRKIKIIDRDIHTVEKLHSIEHYLYISPDIYLADKEHLDQVVSAIRGMPAKTGDPLILNVIYGYDYAKVAQMLKMPVGTVRSAISRARASLRRQFGKVL